jgi:2-phosphosulfolactate phosphatase
MRQPFAEFEIEMEWGFHGVEQLAPAADVCIIVDVLSFTTCVEIAVNREAIVYPFFGEYEDARAYGRSLNAEVASRQRDSGLALSPNSLREIPAGTRLVLPSPNGSRLSLATGATPTLAGCLRNARAIAEYAMELGRQIALIPAGERWPDASLRPSLEDLIGAGAILEHLEGVPSTEAQLARDAWNGANENVRQLLLDCVSGRELVDRGFKADVLLAAESNISRCVPLLRDGAYRAA